MIKRNDELGDLSNQLNHLADILHQHERISPSMGRRFSHELKHLWLCYKHRLKRCRMEFVKATPEHLDAMMRQVSSLKKLTQFG